MTLQKKPSLIEKLKSTPISSLVEFTFTNSRKLIRWILPLQTTETKEVYIQREPLSPKPSTEPSKKFFKCGLQ